MLNVLWVEDDKGNIDEYTDDSFEKLFGTPIVPTSFKESYEYTKNNLAYDFVIIDIDLNKFPDFNEEFTNNIKNAVLFEKFENKSKTFAQVAGFVIYAQLLESGFPKNRVIFLTANAGSQNNTYSEFEKHFTQALMPLPEYIIKDDNAPEKLIEKLKLKIDDYLTLRRGIIEACADLKDIAGDENNLQINNYAKDKISSTDIINYLDTLSQLLPISKPDDLNLKYRIFLRTLAHEWDICIISKEDRNGEKHSASTFVETMKMVRNWVAHDKLLEQYWVTDDKLLKQLNEEIISFLFIVNMRAMFKLENNVQKHELKLLNCISTSPFLDAIDDKKIEESDKYVDNLLQGMSNIKLNGYKYCREYLDKKGNAKTEDFDKRNFNQKINCLHNEKKLINLKYCYQQLLMQYFFVEHLKNESDWLKDISNSNDFLPTLARRIYNRSFS
jgi:hypothetical protein